MARRVVGSHPVGEAAGEPVYDGYEKRPNVPRHGGAPTEPRTTKTNREIKSDI